LGTYRRIRFICKIFPAIFPEGLRKLENAVRLTGLRYLNTGLPEYEAQVLIATLDYAVLAAEFRIKCRSELKLSVGKYLEIVRPTLLFVVERAGLRETVRICIRIFMKLVPCQHGHVHCVPSHHGLVLSYFLVTATS
jgi:hypothetical protein